MRGIMEKYPYNQVEYTRDRQDWEEAYFEELPEVSGELPDYEVVRRIAVQGGYRYDDIYD